MGMLRTRFVECAGKVPEATVLDQYPAAPRLLRWQNTFYVLYTMIEQHGNWMGRLLGWHQRQIAVMRLLDHPPNDFEALIG